MSQGLLDLIHPSWHEAMAAQIDRVREIGLHLRAESAAGRRWFPAGDSILRAFQQPLDDVRILIVGQDPYPTAGHAMGLAFSVQPAVRPLPRSLQNIVKELRNDMGVPEPVNGDLSAWAQQGVLLLNRVLTVQEGQPGSHRNIGWEAVTEAAITGLVARDDAPLVAILWGRDAQALQPTLQDVPCIVSAHPSPMSADRGFFGSRPFSRANEALVDLGGDEVDWTLKCD